MEKELTTLFTGRNLLELDTVDSTNTFLSDLVLKTNCPEGTVVIAKSQNAGRGQAGQRWESDYGQNILISVLFRPLFLLPRQLFVLSQALSLGVLDFLSQYVSSGLSLKWPNDIYYNDNKMGGILLENNLSGQRINSSIFGLGLNINQKVFPGSLPNPVSLSLITETDYDLHQLVPQLLNALEQRYLFIQNGNSIAEEYNSRLYRFNLKANFEDENGKFSGVIKGTNETGRLVIETAGGLKEFDIKQIRFFV